MAYGAVIRFLASETRDREGRKVEMWWLHQPGGWGVEIIKPDSYGNKWSLVVEHDRYLTQELAGRAIGVSLVTIIQWVSNGVFRGLKQHTKRKVVLIPVREVERVARQRGVFSANGA